MAKITNSIGLNDKMTPVLNSIMKSMSATVKCMESLDKSSNKGVNTNAFETAKKSIQETNNAILKMSNTIPQASKNQTQVQNGFKGWNAELGIASRKLYTAISSVINLKNVVGATRTAFTSIPTVVSSVTKNIIDKFKSIPSATKGAIDGIGRGFKSIPTVANSAFNAIKTNIKSIPGAVKGLPTAIKNGFSGLPSMIQNIKGKIGGWKPPITNASSVLEGFKNKLKGTNQESHNVKKGFSGWGSAIVVANQGIQLLKAGFSQAQKVFNMSDELTLTQSRLGFITKDLDEQKALQNDIYEAASRSRGSYTEMQDSVAKLGMLAHDAFADNKEIVKFQELLNKSFAVGGAGLEDQKAGMRQLTQAMASGRLQGDEFVSISENAPMISEALLKHLNISKGELKKLSSEGKITSDIIKNAMFAAGGDITRSFEEMPVTFGQQMQGLKNHAVRAFQGINDKISIFVNSDAFKQMMEVAKQAIDFTVIAIEFLIQKFSELISFVQQNISYIKQIAIVLGVIFSIILIAKIVFVISKFMSLHGWIVLIVGLAMLAVYAWNNLGVAGKILAVVIGIIVAAIIVWVIQQWLLNAALTVNPIIIIIVAIIALIAVITAIIVWVINLWQTNMDFKYGIIGIWNGILDFFDQIPVFFMGIGYGIADAFSVAKVKVAQIMENMANGVIQTINKLINAVNKIVNIGIKPLEMINEAAGIAIKEEGARAKRAQDLANAKNEAAEVARKRKEDSEKNRAKDEAAIAAKKAAAEEEKKKKEQEDNATTPFDPNSIPAPDDTGATSPGDVGNPSGGSLDNIGQVDKIKNDVSITEEDLKYFKDIAKAEYINKYTTLRPVMTVSFGDVHEKADVNEVLSAIETMTEEALNSSL